MTMGPLSMPSSGPGQPAYRPDVDGLRAIAVLSVVGFHAFPAAIPGGFTGVDVFFVISGFLITGLIRSGLAQGRFSFIEFYGRRIRRLFPALLLILVTGGVLGWFTLTPDEYRQLGKHVAGGAGFVSNLVLWDEGGYFDSAASSKPLLHLWSLGIEEQFYIAWPLFLWMAWKLRWKLLAVTVVVGIVSFLLNVAISGIDATEAFYSPLCRVWELMAGAALALTGPGGNGVASNPPGRHSAPALRDAGAVAGAVLMFSGFFLITDDKSYPGWWAIVPVLGTLLIVSAGAQAWPNRTILSNRVLVWFGLISYPLYLWHWLLLSFARLIEYAEIPASARLLLVLVSIVLAWLTYRLVEKPVRYGRHGKAKAIALAALMAAVGCAGYYTWARDGFPFRYQERAAFLEHFDISPPEFRYLKNVLAVSETYRYECDFWDADRYFAGRQTPAPKAAIARSCHERDRKIGNAVFIWGDSHAQALYHGLKSHLPPDWQILQVATSGCLPGVDSGQPSKTDRCAQSNWFAVKAIGEARPDVVVLAQSIGHNLEAYAGIASRLTGLGVRKVILVGPSPRWVTDLPKIVANRLWPDTPQRTYVGIDRQHLEKNRALARGFRPSGSAAFVNLMELLCNEEGCLVYIGGDRKAGITTYDKSHLTPVASDYVARHLLVGQIVGVTPVR